MPSTQDDQSNSGDGNGVRRSGRVRRKPLRASDYVDTEASIRRRGNARNESRETSIAPSCSSAVSRAGSVAGSGMVTRSKASLSREGSIDSLSSQVSAARRTGKKGSRDVSLAPSCSSVGGSGMVTRSKGNVTREGSRAPSCYSTMSREGSVIGDITATDSVLAVDQNNVKQVQRRRGRAPSRRSNPSKLIVDMFSNPNREDTDDPLNGVEDITPRRLSRTSLSVSPVAGTSKMSVLDNSKVEERKTKDRERKKVAYASKMKIVPLCDTEVNDGRVLESSKHSAEVVIIDDGTNDDQPTSQPFGPLTKEDMKKWKKSVENKRYREKYKDDPAHRLRRKERNERYNMHKRTKDIDHEMRNFAVSDLTREEAECMDNFDVDEILRDIPGLFDEEGNDVAFDEDGVAYLNPPKVKAPRKFDVAVASPSIENLQRLNKKRSNVIPPSERDFTKLEYAVPKQYDIGDIKVCGHCSARNYTQKCCSNGKVRIPHPRDHPPAMMQMLCGSGKDSVHYRQHQVMYNSLMSFASVRYDRETDTKGLPYIKVHGEMQHIIGGDEEFPKRRPCFMQIYKYDINEATRYRKQDMLNGDHAKTRILRNLGIIINSINYHARQYRCAKELMKQMPEEEVKNIVILLHDPSAVSHGTSHHYGTMSRPQKEMESILFVPHPDGGPGKSEVFVSSRMGKGGLRQLNYYNPLIDPLSYPLLLPQGAYSLNGPYCDDDEELLLPDAVHPEMVIDPLPLTNEDLEAECEDMDVNYTRAAAKYRDLRLDGYEKIAENEDFGDKHPFEFPFPEGHFQEPALDVAPNRGTDPPLPQVDVDLDEPHPDDDGAVRFLDFPSDEESNGEIEDDALPEVVPEVSVEEQLKLRKQVETQNAVDVRRSRFQRLKEFKEMCFALDESQVLEVFQESELSMFMHERDYFHFSRRQEYLNMLSLAQDICPKDSLSLEIVRSELLESHEQAMLYLDGKIAMEMEKMKDGEYRQHDSAIVAIRELVGLQPECDAPVDDNDFVDVIQQDVDLDTTKKQVFTKRSGKQVYVSRRQYYCHQFQVRRRDYHPFLSANELGQLYLIDCALRMIRERNDNDRAHMIELRGSTKETWFLMRHQAMAQKHGFSFGYCYRVNRKMVSSIGWFKERYQHSMAVIDVTGKPDLFITMTGNPEWPEIKRELLPNTTWHSNPLLVNEVFFDKMQNMLDDIVEKELFGPVVSFAYSIEFQKRGMPHVHLLVTLKNGFKMSTPDIIDASISATIPDKPAYGDPDFDTKMRYYLNVVDRMVHTPCEDRPDAYCQQRNKKVTSKRCTKNFPYDYSDCTAMVGSGKMQYRRPAGGPTVEKKVTVGGRTKTLIADSRHVVPYNPYLLNKYACHINVEAVTNVDVIKYVYKYIFKGYDRALVEFVETCEVDNGISGGAPGRMQIRQNDSVGVVVPKGIRTKPSQIQNVQKRIEAELRKYKVTSDDGKKMTAYDEGILVECFRQMTANEAGWYIQGFPLAGNSHTIKNLTVHDENQTPIFWKRGNEKKIQEKLDSGDYKTPLQGWFALNRVDSDACKLTYPQIPLFYMWNKATYQWIRYTSRPSRIVVHYVPVSPSMTNTFAIRLLAKYRFGVTSFEDLRTVDGCTYPDAVDAARAMGLMDSISEWQNCLIEAKEYLLPAAMRRLFVEILVFGLVASPIMLWTEFRRHLIDEIRATDAEITPQDIAKALYHIEQLLAVHNLSLEKKGLPPCDESIMTDAQWREYLGFVEDGPEEVNHQEESERLVRLLNAEQKAAYITIVHSVYNRFEVTTRRLYFLQGSGGCGKTFLYRAIYHTLTLSGCKVSMIATTGIAATLLIGGTTAHKRFFLPLNIEPHSASTMDMSCKAAQELRDTDAFIIDEATMANRYAFRAIDKLLKDVMAHDYVMKKREFGGKVILLGGDWKQLLPVVPGASQLESIGYALKSDEELWGKFDILTLKTNQRAIDDRAYAKLLENIGNGRINGVESSRVFLPSSNLVTSIDEVIRFTYDGILDKPEEVAKSCVLATLNEETTVINEKVLQMVTGQERVYRAVDTPKAGIGMQVPPEYFRHDIPSGMAPFELKLKVGAVVILLRNLDVAKGLCNGSRMTVVAFHEHIILCRLLTSPFAGSNVCIFRCKMETNESDRVKNKSKFTRLQYPLRLAYCMTINKSQGQTFEKVGVVLNNNVFSHGQLYVAMSRVRKADKIRVFSSSSAIYGDSRVIVVHNLVKQDILEAVDREELVDVDYQLPEPTPAPEHIIPHFVRNKKIM